MTWIDCCECGKAEVHVLCDACREKNKQEQGLQSTDSVQNLHDAAMQVAHAARDLNRQAAELETTAAMKIERIQENEPTRSILYRSAAWLWLRGDSPDRAEDCADEGLRGFPPPSIEAQLREVQEEARKQAEKK